MSDWPGGPYYWSEGRTLYVSIPFTWNLREIKHRAMVGSLVHDRMLVGGPAVELMPGYFDGTPNCEVGHDLPGVLQRVNPQATRTTIGCIRRCRFCGVGQGFIEPGGIRELLDWPDLPLLCDNNLLAASQDHFKHVVDRLVALGSADFNQGLDARLLTDWHAEQIARIKEPLVYLALDHMNFKAPWQDAFDSLRRAGLPKKAIRSYAIIGYDSGPEECWERCDWIESFGIKAIPGWFHELDEMEHNIVTKKQQELGWNDYERRTLMQWFFFHKDAAR